jgi:hypothetical protein
MKKKFSALRTIGTIYKIVGVIIAIFTILGSIGFCIVGFTGGAIFQSAASQLSGGSNLNSAGAGIAGVLAAIWILIMGAIAALSTYALGEGIYLLIDLEENTRRTADLLVKE